MKPRNREINIFNLSMLDVISGAMAAFLIIMVVLIPYYRKESIDYQAIIASLQREVAEAQQQTQAAQAESEQQRRHAEELARQLAKTFLVLYVRWNTRDDVDLHLIDPSGAEFSFQRKRIPGRPGELSEDNVNGPGNEVWEIRDAPPGNYKVFVNLFAVKDRRKPVVVKGRLFHRDGSNPIPETRLTQKGRKEPVATISVDSNGNVSVH
ncbi:MAG: hypothetical protein LGR52_15125 [Candidatus Thiosymbion ectosymbiont of Robbea hypermnestra]|nr:hypothetical protein [Candidatus Thiosymbion ectosymbiont of Robbea hypermnestra]